MVCGAGGAAHTMLHIESVWKTRAVALLAIGVACLPTVAHADADSVMRAERTPAFDVVLTIGPAQSMSPMTMQSPAPTDTSMAGHDMAMQPQQADQGMAVNHWLNVHVTQSDSGAAAGDLTPTI